LPARVLACNRGSVRRLGLVSLSLACTLACTDEAQPWTRVVYEEGLDGRGYSIVQADPRTNTCTRIQLIDFVEPYDYDQDKVDVELRGVSGFVFYEAWFVRDNPPDFVEPDISLLCTNAEAPSDIGPARPFVNGELKFTTPGTHGRPCRVSFDLEVWRYTDFDPELGMPINPVAHAAFAEEVEIYDVGCPHPETSKTRLDAVEAALGHYEGVATVVLSSYDEREGTCVWARLLPVDAVERESEVEVEGAWAYAGVRVALSEPDDCRASLLIDPHVDIGPSRSAGPLRSRGTIGFAGTRSVPSGSGSIDAPCELALDVALETFGEFFWLPDLVHMRAEAVTVASACE
jgi:hypothetical protein